MGFDPYIGWQCARCGARSPVRYATHEEAFDAMFDHRCAEVKQTESEALQDWDAVAEAVTWSE